MTNKEIAKTINFLGKLMELHGENSFRVRTYYSAYNILRKIDKPMVDISKDEWADISGIGPSTLEIIQDLVNSGSSPLLDHFKSQTPEGIQEMLMIRGIGPKKVGIIWHDMKISSVDDLLYACNENRLVNYKGFGLKTQQKLKESLEFHLSSKGKSLYASVHDQVYDLLSKLEEHFPNDEFYIVGDFARQMPIINSIEILTTSEEDINLDDFGIDINDEANHHISGVSLEIIAVLEDNIGTEIFMRNGSTSFIEASRITYQDEYAYEEDIFNDLGISYVKPCLRNSEQEYDLATENKIPDLISIKDIKGIVHAHSTYSDGIHNLKQMAEACRSRGYQYLVITDHSQSAFYANGLKPDRVVEQWEEIDQLNLKLDQFKIFKGIESDILSNGDLDYSTDILKGFDVVISSIHSNLDMDKEKATNRLIKAIENPFTHILGHPTGRLLLGRKGYPIDHQKIIDACAANQVAIELNCNPLRMDLDWKWIKYAIDQKVYISINPDAHSIEQIDYVKYGVITAQKGQLTQEHCLNSMGVDQFHHWMTSKS